MIDLSKRSTEKELLDSNEIPFDDIKLNLLELNKINTLLGGHKITIDGMKKMMRNYDLKKTITICETGCGGGDNLIMLKKWCAKNDVPANFIGVDIKKECIDFCKQQHSDSAEWICSDYRTAIFQKKPDIIFSSLFCHHFTDTELKEMMIWMKENSNHGFFINDLQRNIIAYHSIKFLTHLFSNSYLVKNDAPLSVTRSFSKSDWEHILSGAGLHNYTIEWKWAFRYLITFINSPLAK